MRPGNDVGTSIVNCGILKVHEYADELSTPLLNVSVQAKWYIASAIQGGMVVPIFGYLYIRT